MISPINHRKQWYLHQSVNTKIVAFVSIKYRKKASFIEQGSWFLELRMVPTTLVILLVVPSRLKPLKKKTIIIDEPNVAMTQEDQSNI